MQSQQRRGNGGRISGLPQTRERVLESGALARELPQELEALEQERETAVLAAHLGGARPHRVEGRLEFAELGKVGYDPAELRVGRRLRNSGGAPIARSRNRGLDAIESRLELGKLLRDR